MKSILVTGGAGFIGSNFIPWFLAAHPDHAVVNLDKLTYAGDPANLAECEGNPRYAFVKGDVGNRELVEHILRAHAIAGIVHFAAESHVDNSIEGPDVFIRTNVYGTFTLLDAARRFWMSGPRECRTECRGARFLHVSTDEVYGSLGPEGFFTETSPYAPNSPYSASKAGSDMIVRSYFHTYGMDCVITNCSNNYGPKQHGEKLIPTIIRKAVSGEPIPIYGDGRNVRDYCAALDAAFHHGRPGETYNIGARNERVNLDIARTICRLLDEMKPRADGGKYEEQITFVKDRPGHDRRYAIDPAKIERELGWRPAVDFEAGLRKTIEWYLGAK